MRVITHFDAVMNYLGRLVKYRLLLSTVLFVVSACSVPSDDVAGPPAHRLTNSSLAAQGALADRYIVVFHDAVVNPSAEADDIVRQYGGEVHYRYSAALKGFAATLPAAALSGIANNPNVAYIEQDAIATTTGSGTDLTATWGLDRIDQRALPLNGTYQWGQDGAGVRAYIIDTGILTAHTQFGGRASIGYDAFGGTGQDCNGHGTHVAGTVGGAEYGVAKATTLIAVRVLDCGGTGPYSVVIAGVDWVTANRIKPAVANMSLTGGVSAALNQSVTNAINAGVVFAVAAGNYNADACLYSPASAAAAITVGATTSGDVRATYSNFGTCLDVFAPGSSITSAWYTSTTATNTISGTSMASPHVAGVAAQYLSANPTATPAAVRTSIIADATLNAVTDPGLGSVNYLLHSVPPSANPAPTASFTYSCTNLSCSFNGSASSDPGGSIASYAWNFGDGTTGSGATPNKSYATAGTRTVTLTVTDNLGATGSTSQSVTVTAPPPSNSPPTARYAYSCTNLSCTFDGGGSTDADGSIASYLWDFGDGTTASSAADYVYKTYASGGTRTVTLTVTDNLGATASISKSVTVTAPLPANTPPIASFTYSCTDLNCSFNGSGSSDPGGSIASYAWNFGDGTTGSGATPNKTYATAGTRTVTLTVTDNGGLTGSASQSVTATAPPPPVGIVLNATPGKQKGILHTILDWSGATALIDVYRDGVKVATAIPNSGTYDDNLGVRGSGSYTYKVCHTGTTTCSNNAVVTF